MSSPVVHEIQVQSAINPVKGMPFKWSLNPYKGCAHACTYCYARAYHSYLDLPPSTFESQLFVKTNVAEVLRAELRRPSWRAEPVVIGTATDPYQPLESRYRLTRRCLEAMAEVENPGSVTTKGTLVIRDIDVLSDLSRSAHFTVNVSLISLDRDLLRKLEPGAPAPASRLRAIECLSQAGIRVSVLLAPVLPGITDLPEQMEEVVRAAAERGARSVGGGPLRLAPGVKEHFLEVIERHFPLLSPGYRRLYAAGPNAPTGYQLRIQSQMGAMRRAEGLEDEASRPPAAPTAARGQLALPFAQQQRAA